MGLEAEVEGTELIVSAEGKEVSPAGTARIRFPARLAEHSNEKYRTK